MSETVEIVSSSDEEDVIPAKKRKLSHNLENRIDDEELSPASEGTSKEISRLFVDSKEMQEMLQKCYEKINNENTKDTFITKARLLKRHYDAVGPDYIQSEEFKKEMRRRIDVCNGTRLAEALRMFIELFTELESASKQQDELSGNRRAIRKLEKFLKQVHKKITELENTEVNFDDEENSTYLQAQRYRDRAVKIYKKLCEYRNENVSAGDITKQRIDFSGSDNVQINRAINRTFKNGLKFPTYLDVEQCIRKCVNRHDMAMSESKIKGEARSCFEKLGNLLQKRRKVDLLNMHSTYLKTNQDPVADNPSLIDELNRHKSEAQKAISDICQKYVRLQEEGKDVEVSDDSDDSNYATSEENELDK